jgi:hydrogenase maturation protease
MRGDWDYLERPRAESVEVAGERLWAGSRVRLHPGGGADVFDLALAGRTAIVEAIEQDTEGRVSLAVVVDDDPGRELGLERQLGHRFFFSPAEVEPLSAVEADDAQAPEETRAPQAPARRILLAGIGNVFLGDDGFGVALAERLARRPLPEGTDVVDFGIRGIDLAYAMQDGYDAVVMLDAAPRGQRPGTVYLIEAEIDAAEVTLDAHGMDPVKVLGLVRALGGAPPRTFVVGCEPQTQMRADDEELLAELSEPVRAALEKAEKVVESLLAELIASNEKEVSGS